jgi:N-methylhydantoinase B/oxoprolinase/acetone carboxylase alpha subunit
VIRENGAQEELPGKTSVRLRRGERVRIESPGGGGWGKTDSPRKHGELKI